MVTVSCFGVRVSVMIHLMFVHYTFSSVWIAEWPLSKTGNRDHITVKLVIMSLQCLLATDFSSVEINS